MANSKRIRFQRLVLGLRNALRKHKATPEALIGAALASWCSQSFSGLPRSGLPAPVALQRDTVVSAFVDFIRANDLQEATYWFASAYAQLAGEKPRKQLSMFFTPPSLAKRLLDDLGATGVDFSSRSFCDPACGGAAFLAPIAIRMRDALRANGSTPAQVIKHIEAHLLGMDKNRTLCKLSRHFLLMALHGEIVNAGIVPKFKVIVRDSLLTVSRLIGTLDVVVCNPPFRKVSAVEMEEYADEFSDVIDAQPNLYALFMAQCVKLLRVGGTCALVTPTSFLSGQYFSKLRTFLMTHTKVLRIAMVNDRQGIFIDVQQETALTLAQREDNKHADSTVANVCLVSRDGKYADVGRCTLPNTGAVWPIPRRRSDVVLLRRARKSAARLSDYGYAIRIGAFVWNRDSRTTYASAKSAARARGRSAVPLLWSSDIAADGSLRFNGSPKDREPCFVNLGSKSHRSVVRRPSVLLQRVTASNQPRRLVAAAIPEDVLKTYGGFVGENHTVILEQVAQVPALPPRQLAQLLGTTTIDRCFRCISGATNVSAFELKHLSLPDPNRLKELLAQGYDIAEAARVALTE